LPPKIKIQIKIARPNLIRKTPSSCGAATAQMWEALNDFLRGGSHAWESPIWFFPR
jgi:hypothetical protein